MLADLSGQIQQHYGFNIGYLNPAIPMPMDPSIDFLIFESPAEDEELQCFHKDDIVDQARGPVMVRTINSDPEHDSKVEELFARLNNDVLNGLLIFDPGVTREVDGVTVSVTKKFIPQIQKDVFDTNLFSEGFGSVYPYEVICDKAKVDKKFQIAKDIIDELWPQPQPEVKRSEPGWLTKFKKWFL
jgi:hypothetical protein